MKRYKLTYILAGLPSLNLEGITESLMRVKQIHNYLGMEPCQWLIRGRLVTCNIHRIISDDYLAVKDAAVILICYDPRNNESVNYAKDWLLDKFGKVPYTSEIYLVSLFENQQHSEMIDLQKAFFTCHHITLNMNNPKRVKHIFMQAAKRLIDYISEKRIESLPGLRLKQNRNSYCPLW